MTQEISPTPVAPPPIWQPKWLISAHVVAIILMGSWLLPATRPLWDALDTVVFRTLNGTLAWGSVWQGFWAIANWRPFDILAGIVILMFLLHWFRSEPRSELGGRLVAFLLFGVVVVTTKVVSFQTIVDIFDYHRPSPTWVFEDTLRLTQLVDWIKTKDASGSSFPGDHALVLVMTTFFFVIHGGRRLGSWAAVAFIPFVLPRLVGGAHWITDILCGAIPLALVGLSWWYATPLYGRVSGFICRTFPGVVTGAARWVGRMPGVR
ncbi:MAG: phosphatase PAP2 family protein [Magnetococcales bacterium]|nr:phosphatase PAP2 family protein [Magnetococcales bacterium]